jgi:ATP-dependent DNA helicase RecG
LLWQEKRIYLKTKRLVLRTAMNLEELKSLASKGESETLEFKKTTGQRSEAARTICAFLNGAGGILLFGVSDKGVLLGQQVSTKTLEDLTIEINKIEPTAIPEVETIPIGNDKSILAVKVSGKCGSYLYDGRPYLRQGPATQIMEKDEYDTRVMRKLHVNSRWENERAPSWVTIDDLDHD